MKRFNLKPTITVTEDRMNFGRRTGRVDSVMEESPSGKWVRWEDAEALCEYLENQIPEKRIAKLERMIGLVNEGKCPECGEKVREYKAPLGSFGPEAFASLREAGINPSTGHRSGCSLDGRDRK